MSSPSHPSANSRTISVTGGDASNTINNNHLSSQVQQPNETHNLTTNIANNHHSIESQILLHHQATNDGHNTSILATSTTNDDYRNYFTLPKMDNFVDAFSICCSTAVIFGGLVPYIPQYLKIKRSVNSDGFSTYVCLTLLLANIMRIMFWFGHHFEPPLLIQSFVMIIGMLAMMDICVRVRDKSSSYIISAIGVADSNRRRRFLNGWTTPESRSVYSVLGRQSSPDFPTVAVESANYHRNNSPAVSYHNQPAYHESFESRSGQLYESVSAQCQVSPSASSNSTHFFNRSLPIGNGNLKCSSLRDFWDWDDLFSYLKFLTIFTFIVGMITYLLIDNYIYIETIGFIAVLTESMLGMPQLLRNHTKKSTRGMSVEMVIMWLSGDLFKTLYFIIRKTPAQFYVCGAIQVIVDILILGQVLWYKRPNVTYRKLPKST